MNPEEYLAKFGYKLTMKFIYFLNPSILWATYLLEPCYKIWNFILFYSNSGYWKSQIENEFSTFEF
jgi:hypothetical protein